MANILIADDEPEICELIKIGFEKRHHVHVVHDGESALSALATEHYDLLILDLKMPGIGGEGVLEKREDFPETKVVVLTAYPNLETAVSAVRRTATDYLFKPIQIPELIKVVEGHLNRYEVGPFAVDMSTTTLLYKNKTVPLPPGLFDILLVFMRNPNRMLHHTDIAESLVRDPRTADQYPELAQLLTEGEEGKKQISKYLRAQISRLRRELNKYLPEGMEAIFVQRRKGFWWNPAVRRGDVP